MSCKCQVKCPDCKKLVETEVYDSLAEMLPHCTATELAELLISPISQSDKDLVTAEIEKRINWHKK